MSETYTNFVFYKEWLDQLMVIAKGGTTEDLAALCSGLKSFLDGETPEDLTPLASMMLNQMTAQIERDKGHLKEISDKRRQNREGKTKDNKQEQNTTNDNKTEQTTTKQGVEEEVEVEVEDDVSPNGDKCIAGAEPLIGLPLNDGTEHQVTQEDLNEYSALYPAVNVMQELRDMRGWLLANPSRKKTKRGIKAFIRTWLSKEQDKPRSSPHKLTAAEITQLPFIDPFAELREARP